jgi:gliding motility-associated-like protein
MSGVGGSFQNSITSTSNNNILWQPSFVGTLQASVTGIICGANTAIRIVTLTSGVTPSVTGATFTDPSCGGSNGIVNISLQTGGGNYDIDINGDGIYERTNIPSIGNIVSASGFNAGSTVSVISVRLSGGSCVSNFFPINYTFGGGTSVITTLGVSLNTPTICPVDNALITIATSQGGAFYQAFIGATNYGTTVAGNGSNAVITISGATLALGTNNVRIRSIIPGCATGTLSGLASITITSPPTVNTLGVQSFCGTLGTTLTLTGASSYIWQPGSLTGNIQALNPSSTQTYTVTGSVGSCSSSRVFTITVSSVPVVNVSPSSLTICSGSGVSLTATGANSYNWMPGNLSGAIQSLSPSVTQSFTVTGTSAQGCSGVGFATVTVNPSLTVSFGVSPTSVCIGSSVTITVSGASNYNWQPGNLTGNIQSFTPSTTQTYTVTGTSGVGCSDTKMLTVTVNSVPSVSINGISSICVGSSTSLTATGANTYNWMPGSITGAIQSLSPLLSQLFTVTGTSAQGCTGIATRTVTVNGVPNLVVSGNLTICEGGNTSLTATGANTYNWLPGSLTGAIQSLSPLLSQSFTVTGTSAQGCTTVTTRTVTVNPFPAGAAMPTGLTSVCNGTGTSSYTTSTGIANSTGRAWSLSQIAGGTGIAPSINATTGVVSWNDYVGQVSISVAGTNGCGTGLPSNGLLVTRNSSLIQNVALTSSCNGTNFTVSFGFTGGAGGVYSLTGTNIGGVQTLSNPYTYTSGLITGGTAPSYSVTDGCSVLSVSSAPVNCACPPPTYNALTNPSVVCEGGNVVVTLTGVTDGGTAVTGYVWELSTNGGSNFSRVITGTVSSTTGQSRLSLSGMPFTSHNNQYRVKILDGCPVVNTVTSNVAIISVNPIPGATTVQSSGNSCEGVSTTSQFTATGVNATSYVWGIQPTMAGIVDANGLVTWNAGFSGSATITASGVGVCGAGTTGTASVTRYAALGHNSLITSSCTSGLEATVSFMMSGGLGSGYLVNGSSVGVSGNTFTSGLTPNGAFNFFVSDGSGCAVGTVTGTINCSCGNPVIGTSAGALASVCTGSNSSTISYSNITDVYAPFTYTWLLNDVVINPNTGIYSDSETTSNGGGASLTITNATSVNNGGVYKLAIRNSCGTSITTTGITLNVNALPTGTFSSIAGICAGVGSISLGINGLSNGGNTLVINSSIAGFTSQTFTGVSSGTSTQVINVPTNLVSGSYGLTITTGNSGNACVSSQSVGFTVNPIPSITVGGSIPDICFQSTQMTIPYTASGGGATRFSLSNSTLIGFVPINDANITAGQLVVAVPSDMPASQSHRFDLTVSNGFCSSASTPVDVLVNVNPSVGAVSFNGGSSLSNGSRCQGAGNTDYAASAANATSIVYRLNPGTAGTINAAGLVTWNAGFTGTATINGIASGNCGNPTTVTGLMQMNSTLTTPVFSYGEDNVLCITELQTDQTPTFSAGFVSGGTYSTGADSGTGALNSDLLAGIYTITFTTPVSGACAAVSGSTTITIVGTPTALNVSPSTRTICSGSSSVVSVTGAETGTMYYLYKDNTNTNQTSANGSFTVNAAGVYSIKATNAVCNISQTNMSGSLNLTVNTQQPTPILTYTGNSSICRVGGSNPLISTNINQVGTFTGVGIGTNGKEVSSTSILDLVQVPAGTSSVMVTYTYSDGVCPSVSGDVNINISEPLAKQSLSYEGSGSICQNSPVLSPVNALPGGATYGSSAGLDINSETGEITPRGSKSGTYEIRVTVSGNGACEGYATTTGITIQAPSEIILTSAGTTVTGICEQTDIPLTVGTMGTNGISSLTWEARVLGADDSGWRAVTLTGENQNYRSDKLSESVEYRALNTLANCGIAYSNVVRVEVSKTSEGGIPIVSDAAPEESEAEICGNKSSTEISLSNYRGNILWERASKSDTTKFEAINLVETPSATSSVLKTPDWFEFNSYMLYRAKVQNGSCEARYSKVVKVRSCNISNWVPNALTPNSGNQNSVWDISAFRLLNQADVRIYNRYGVEVVRKTGQEMNESPWDGGNLPAGTYYYIIDRNDNLTKPNQLTGVITVVK